MNSLAHSFLSGFSEQLLVGNFIGDFIKGKAHKNLPPAMSRGVVLHRFIDSYTDSSDFVKQSTEIFKPLYGRYAGIVVDVVYDHFLSTNWEHYAHYSRDYFIQYVHNTLLTYFLSLPAQARKYIQPVVFNNWMTGYASLYGIEKVLRKMSQRTSLPNNSSAAMHVLRQNYTSIEEHFNSFFPTIVLYTQELLQSDKLQEYI